MKSLKDTIRRGICTTLLAALTTSYFVGCNRAPEITDSDLYGPDTTTSVSDTLTPGIVDTDTDTFSIKYKYWYDNPDVAEAQASSLAELLNAPGVTLKGEAPNFPGVNLYSDADGNEFLVSGRTPIYLHNGKLSTQLLDRGIRNAEGILQYFNVSFDLEQFSKLLAESNAEQFKSFAERVENDTAPNTSDVMYEVFINNITTGYNFRTGDMLDITGLLTSCNRGSFSSDTNTLTLFTAAGDVSIQFVAGDTSMTLTYTDESNNVTTTTIEYYSEILELTPAGISMTLESIEDYLGFDVEVYDTFINIVTDNKDIATENSISNIPIMELIDDSLADTDSSKPMSDPENQAIIESNNTRMEETNPIQPAESGTEVTETTEPAETPEPTQPNSAQTSGSESDDLDSLAGVHFDSEEERRAYYEEMNRRAEEAMLNPEEHRDWGHTGEEIADIFGWS